MTEPDFFDRTEMRLRAGMRRGAHLPWHARLTRFRSSRPVAIVVAALVVATPAVAAATNWFGIGAPNRIPSQSPTQNAGRAFASTSELLPLRVPDPNGGPPWGMRIVRTTRGATCVQVGRVEDGQVGSLGIDGAWKNDHLFHPFPKPAEGNGFQCGTTDGAGHAFFDSEYMGMSPSAMTWNEGGPGTRLVYMGLLGPDATSITYETPTRRLASAKTSGSDGAYLFVFARNNKTCKLYADNPNRMVESPQCSGVSGGEEIGSPIRNVTYRDGQICWPGLSPTMRSSWTAFEHEELAKLNIKRATRLNSSQRAQFEQDQAHFVAARHVTLATFQLENVDRCPAVGYVAPHERRLTTTMVEAPIHIHVEPDSKGGIPVQLSFTARQPVTSASSWYEGALTGPCEGRSVRQIGFGNIHVGQILRDNQILSPGGQHPSCKGAYHGIISYMQNSGPIGAVGQGTQQMPGKDGSIVVARFSFTVR